MLIDDYGVDIYPGEEREEKDDDYGERMYFVVGEDEEEDSGFGYERG